jgi:hypothetical protein
VRPEPWIPPSSSLVETDSRAGGQAAVTVSRDERAERLPAASTASTPKTMAVPQWKSIDAVVAVSGPRWCWAAKTS